MLCRYGCIVREGLEIIQVLLVNDDGFTSNIFLMINQL